ncbi:hypothetical protein HW132_05555 [Brasilonema sp. CT11]|nr:hypothetical protein [Brasilonema sp. CT11]
MQELAQVLQADCCQIELYSNDQIIATVAYEYTTTELSRTNVTHSRPANSLKALQCTVGSG